MSHVAEFSNSAIAAASSGDLTVPAGGVAVGHTLVIGVACIDPGVVSATDTKGNTYTLEQQHPMTGGGSESVAAQLHCVVTNALVSGDTITVAFGATSVRWAIQAQHFDDEVTSIDTGDWGDNGGVFTAALDMGAPSSDDTSALYVASCCMLNVGRTYTPGSGWTAGTKVQSTVSSGERAIQMMWRFGSGTYTADATLSSSGQFVGVSQAYGLDETAPPTGPEILGTWDGSDLEPVGLLGVWNGTSLDPAEAFHV